MDENILGDVVFVKLKHKRAIYAGKKIGDIYVSKQIVEIEAYETLKDILDSLDIDSI